MKWNRERVLNLIGIDSTYIKDCDDRRCRFCREGCLLGYPFETFQGGIEEHSRFLDMLEDIKKLYSKEFSDYWKSQEPNKNEDSDKFLPCSHSAETDCSPDKCNHLNNRDFMSKEYQERMLRNNR